MPAVAIKPKRNVYLNLWNFLHNIGRKKTRGTKSKTFNNDSVNDSLIPARVIKLCAKSNRKYRISGNSTREYTATKYMAKTK